MTIFNQTPTWPDKVNFVDENNVVLGYDLEQTCCEWSGWFIADQPYETLTLEQLSQLASPQKASVESMPGWVFDTDYARRVTGLDCLESGNLLIVRLVRGADEKFLHVFNAHNGAYGHGFTFQVGPALTAEGVI